MVNKAVLHPQEIETFYIIPTLRKHLALALIQQGKMQKDVATLLGINSAAISQYRSNKRGKNVEFPELIINNINESAKKITDQHTYFKEIQYLLKVIRDTKFLCQIHHQFSSVPSDCHPEKVGCFKGGYI
ncbi:hypothetical protein COV20_06380 [Candidatus Woesearchaeota archaeon CG10_big_fil_rev_8_21_14_0_10_45_16]|nr:MAG: hypothetical protein COV20_06380 [Candidatus Woesearchaeota archaeon CG10_big_fil_rev_8_21_14_0_10_45_16]